jgi:energy-coupling factor transport system substrate-specific component
VIEPGNGPVSKRLPTTAPIVLVAIGIVLNVTVGQLVRNVFEFPFYLDSIGTVLVGVLAGPLAGAITGAASNVTWGLIFDDSDIIPYAITATCIGVAAGVAASLGAFTHPLRVALAGFLTGVMAALVSAPITADLLEGRIRFAVGRGVSGIHPRSDVATTNLVGTLAPTVPPRIAHCRVRLF